MYNLEICTAMAAAASNNSATPRTPEIVNSLIAMTNPLDFNFGEGAQKRLCASTCGASSDSNSSSSSNESRAHPRLTTLPVTSAPSIQQTCSQLIKAGLKLSIEQKRKLQSDNEDLLDLDKVKRIKRIESESEEDKHLNSNELTPEDEERRRRRRERNKIAATKCRLKKRERTANLIAESEILETQNVEFKSQYANLTKEKQRLEDVLRLHKTTCRKDFRNELKENGNSTYTTPLPPVHSIETTNQNSYPRLIKSVEQFDETNFFQGNYSNLDLDPMYCAALQYKAPSIIVESINDDDYPNLTDLDNPTNINCAYSYGQNQNNYGIDGCMA